MGSTHCTFIFANRCFGITKLSQKLSFKKGNVVLIYAPNGLMKTSFAKTLQLYGQGKENEVRDVIVKPRRK